MRIVSWNMNHCQRFDKKRKEAWNFLRDELHADLVLAQEASPPSQFKSVYRPIDDRNPNFKWGSAVVALHPDLILKARTRVPAPDCYNRVLELGELPDTHPGACAVADVRMKRGQHLFTAISLYASLEMMPGGNSYSASPRLHRMLSDLTGVFAVAHRHPVVLAGDLNVTTQDEDSQENEVAAVFARLRAWSLVDCIARTRANRPRLSNCVCADGDACSHVQTFRSKNRVDSWPRQLDYAFVSEPAVSTLSECRVVHDAAAWKLSDHCPILLELNVLEDK